MNVRNRVLIIDVDERVLLDLQRTLEDAGFDTTVTWDSGEARRILRDYDFQLLMVCDHPPEVVPTELLSQLSAQLRLPRSVIVTCSGETNISSAVADPPSKVCKHNYEEVLRTVQAQLHRVRLACAS